MKTTITKTNFTGNVSGDFRFTNAKGHTYTVQMATWQVAEARAKAKFSGNISATFLGRSN